MEHEDDTGSLSVPRDFCRHFKGFLKEICNRLPIQIALPARWRLQFWFYTTDEEALLGEMNNYRAIFWCVLLGLHNAFGEYIFMDLLWIIHFEKIIKKRNFNFKNFDNLQMFKILNDFWCTCVVVVFCFYGVYSII